MSLLKVVRGLSERGENGKSLVGGCVCDGMERWKTRGRNTLAPTYLSTTLDVGEVVMVAIVDCCVECLEDCLEVAIRVLTYTPVYQVTYSRVSRLKRGECTVSQPSHADSGSCRCRSLGCPVKLRVYMQG